MKIWINSDGWIEKQERNSRLTVEPFRTIDVYISTLDITVSLRKKGILIKDFLLEGCFDYTIDILEEDKNTKLYVLNCFKHGVKRRPCPSFVWESDESILDCSKEFYSKELLDLFGAKQSGEKQEEFSLDI